MNIIGLTYGPASGLILYLRTIFPDHNLIVGEENFQSLSQHPAVVDSPDKLQTLANAEGPNRVYINLIDKIDVDSLRSQELGSVIVAEWVNQDSTLEKANLFLRHGIEIADINQNVWADDMRRNTFPPLRLSLLNQFSDFEVV